MRASIAVSEETSLTAETDLKARFEDVQRRREVTWRPSSPMSDDVSRHGGDEGVGRAATPAEIAHTVAFLASQLSGYTTGTVLTINGGG